MKLVIATPVRGAGLAAGVTVGYSESVRKLSRMMLVEEVPAAIAFGCDVVRARNRIAAKILRDGWATHVLWWDDDQWPTDVGIVQRMIDAGEDFIAAPCTNKAPPIKWHHQSDEPHDLDTRGLLEVDRTSLGFALMKLSVIGKMSWRARRYTDAPSADVVADLFGLMFSGPGDETDTLMSEDYSFCKRWRDMGGRIWIDGRAGNLVHHVGQRTYNAHDIEGGVT